MAKATGLNQTIISAHIHNRRPVSGWHLLAYLKAADAEERPRLVAAWLRTHLPPDLANEVLGGTARIAETGIHYSPKVDDNTRRAFDYLIAEAAGDPELAKAVRVFARHMGAPTYSGD